MLKWKAFIVSFLFCAVSGIVAADPIPTVDTGISTMTEPGLVVPSSDTASPVTSTSPVILSSTPARPLVDNIQHAFLRRVVGIIESLDAEHHTLNLKNRAGAVKVFTLTPRTQVSKEGKRRRVSNLKTGQQVMIMFVEGTSFVRKILIISQ